MELQESELGSKEYWCQQYTKELHNFKEFGDQGEVWFGEDVQDRMCEFICDISSGMDLNQVSLLDIGTGNGSLLFELKRMGFSKLIGSDYSKESLQLCKEIASNEESGNGIKFVVDDLLDTKIQERFDIVADKGTFDAISLMENSAAAKQSYVQNVGKLVKTKGLLIITSCNYTIEELTAQICTDKYSYFVYKDHVRDYPQIDFGGRSGSKVCTVAFVRS
eukprot:TRINITY_DN8797_c0_g1_i2.p2 TRINITY_DN8797_c0_g1~~TRINITY_DN8797_c0_g1_i2.p2  ORF type:complete len:220 (+),score=31.18 TRINITY_DN8797_c0_g1_i2:171-830(+)